eukprot:CAMPEP_0113660596 /NCGR_PEP_ID=MMETSP0017_2-20120614/32986_1 /TAXON_ID=2856 /ORGANISM="Cylindrotheca closterium" /LENGTH=691 /DNA_ID=CAMNT_0000575245 /DNA_START=94 /DNA_END=2169 /DNA_ORIENTATION=+ /assembly_acc=CAM_ASM_000147
MHRVLRLCLLFLFSVDGFVPKSPLRSVSRSSNVASSNNFSPAPKTVLNSQCQEVTSRIGFRNRVKSAWQKVILQRNNKNTKAGLSKRRVLFGAAAFVVSLMARPLASLAMGAMGGSKGPVAPMERKEILTVGGLFFALFVGLALLHAAEIAITTLYPWKVREFAEEEEKSGKQGVFQILDEDITRVLTTILVASTTCSIFATTVFTHLVASAFGAKGERYGALALTCLTLFFVELLPKSIGVTNAEKVARVMTPPISVISTVVSPLGISLTWLAKKTLTMVGLNSKDDGDSISDSQLRLIVTGARDSGTIDRGEQEMIQGVLELQTQRVKEIMKPRVEIIAVPKDMSVASVLGVVRESGYSRIPVYEGEIDNIVGIVLAKNVLDFFVKGVLVDDEDVIRKIRGEESSGEEESDEEGTKKLSTLSLDDRKTQNVLTGSEMTKRMQESIKDAGLIESCYFVPETANGWSVLQEMRKRRVHMAVVVDEFGGTEGLVSLEDIVEEVVGEIYDEDDEEEYDFSEDSITLQEDGSFLVRGDADLEDCDTILDLKLGEEDALKEFSTLSGFLCMCAGEIPNMGDFVMSRGYSFEILQADDKKILQVKVDRLIGAFDDESELEEDNNMLRGFLKNNLDEDDDYEDMESEVDDQLEQTRVANKEAAKEIEQIIEGGAKKADLVEKALQKESKVITTGSDS